MKSRQTPQSTAMVDTSRSLARAGMPKRFAMGCPRHQSRSAAMSTPREAFSRIVTGPRLSSLSLMTSTLKQESPVEQPLRKKMWQKSTMAASHAMQSAMPKADHSQNCT